MSEITRKVCYGVGIGMIVGGLAVACAMDATAGKFECPKCGTNFTPSIGQYLIGAHTLFYRKLTCPKCGERSMCKHHLITTD